MYRYGKGVNKRDINKWGCKIYIERNKKKRGLGIITTLNNYKIE